MKSLSTEDRDLFLTNEIINLGYSLDQVETVKKTRAYTVYLDLARKDRESIYQMISWIQQMKDK